MKKLISLALTTCIIGGIYTPVGFAQETSSPLITAKEKADTESDILSMQREAVAFYKKSNSLVSLQAQKATGKMQMKMSLLSPSKEKVPPISVAVQASIDEYEVLQNLQNGNTKLTAQGKIGISLKAIQSPVQDAIKKFDIGGDVQFSVELQSIGEHVYATLISLETLGEIRDIDGIASMLLSSARESVGKTYRFPKEMFNMDPTPMLSMLSILETHSLFEPKKRVGNRYQLGWKKSTVRSIDKIYPLGDVSKILTKFKTGDWIYSKRGDTTKISVRDEKSIRNHHSLILTRKGGGYTLDGLMERKIPGEKLNLAFRLSKDEWIVDMIQTGKTIGRKIHVNLKDEYLVAYGLERDSRGEIIPWRIEGMVNDYIADLTGTYGTRGKGVFRTERKDSTTSYSMSGTLTDEKDQLWNMDMDFSQNILPVDTFTLIPPEKYEEGSSITADL